MGQPSRNLLSVLLTAFLFAGAFNLMSAAALRLPVASVVASTNDGNVASNTIDGNLSTRWSASGDGQWIQYTLGASTNVGSVRIAWHNGNQRVASFDVQTSVNGTSWTTVLRGSSSGSTIALETYDVTDSTGRYVRIVGHGNSVSAWNSITEVEIYGPGTLAAEPTGLRLRISRTSSPSQGSVVTLQWNSKPQAQYQVQASPNLTTWTDVGNPITSTSSSQLWTEVVSSLPSSARARRYYRLKEFVAIPEPPEIEKQLSSVQVGSRRAVVWCNRPITTPDSRVTRAIIVIHGSGGNAEGYFDRMNDVVPSAWREKTIVLAPHFQEESEAGSGELWWDGDWREGGNSGGASSYTVVDTMIGLLRNGAFPNLKWVIVGGHSAGGQFSQRYAAFTDVDLKAVPNAELIKFVPANPSSYVYLNEYRYIDGSWRVPSQDCSSGDGYNEWKYGLTGLSGYAASRGAAFARTHLPRRWVELLGGDEDVEADEGLDMDCAAMFQGERRYERAQIFDMFMDRYYPSNHFTMTTVPGVNHDSASIFASPQGINAYFFAD